MLPSDTGTNARLGLGATGLGNHRVALDDADALTIVDEAWNSGLRLFDTAPHYGLGLSERRLGAALASRPRSEYRLSTKVGRSLVPRPNPQQALDDDEQFLVPADHDRVWDFTERGIRACIESSLGRLETDYIDVAYLHDPERWDLEAALATGVAALLAVRNEGLVRRVGVASMQLRALVQSARFDGVEELMAAGRLTLLDRRAVGELLPICVARNIGVTAAAPFNGGVLADSLAGPSLTYDYAPADPEVVARSRDLHDTCAAFGVPLRAAALQFPVRQPAVHSVVVGAVRPGQIESNAALMAMALPEELWQALDATSAHRREPVDGSTR
jgi:D-threo-aldose 1-dehydrogenase